MFSQNDPICALRSGFAIAHAFAPPSFYAPKSPAERATNEAETREFWGIMRLLRDTQRADYAGPDDCEVLAGPEAFTPPTVKVQPLRDHHGAKIDYLERKCADCGQPSEFNFCHFFD